MKKLKMAWVLLPVTAIVSMSLLSACAPQATSTQYVPPGEVTTVKTYPGPGNQKTAVIVKRPIPGQYCWKQNHVWYCQPAR